MRRAFLLLAVMALALVVASGAAVAVSKTGDDGNNRLVGTNDRDTLAGGGGNDEVYGKGARDRLYGDSGRDLVQGGGGPDQLFGGQGFDRVFGGRGDDFINVLDERNDVVDCGAGDFDEVYADFEDTIRDEFECEVVLMASAEPLGSNAGSLGPEELEGASFVKRASP